MDINIKFKSARGQADRPQRVAQTGNTAMRRRFGDLVDNYVRHSVPLRDPALANLALHVLDSDLISILNHTADVHTINEFFVLFLHVWLLCI